MMPVRHEKLPDVSRAVVHTPEARTLDLDVRLSRGRRDIERPVGQEEDRLRLHARGPKEIETVFSRVRGGSLVGEHGARLVGLGGQRDDEPLPLALDAVRTDIALRDDPRARVVVSREDPRGQPVPVERGTRSGGVGQRQMEDVVGTLREKGCTLLVVHRVVRRSDEIRQRTGRAGVANGAKRRGVGHRGERTNG